MGSGYRFTIVPDPVHHVALRLLAGEVNRHDEEETTISNHAIMHCATFSGCSMYSA